MTPPEPDPAPVAPPLPVPRNPRYRSLDFWRGVACLMVVVYHGRHYLIPDGCPTAHAHDPLSRLAAEMISKMWIGVPIFFLISGYCISATGDSTRRKPGRLGQYFLRRFRRIFPPYWALLGLSLSAFVLLSLAGRTTLLADRVHPIPDPATLSWEQWAGNVTLTEIWRPHLGGDPCRPFIDPSWTLCYEEQFYAVVGLLLLLAPRRLFSATLLLTAGVALLTVGLARLGWLPAVSGFFVDGQWFLFAAGVLLYYRLNYAPRKVGYAIDVLLALFGVACWVIRYRLLSGPTADPDWQALWYQLGLVSGFAVLLSCCRRWDARLADNKLLRPITFCGTICYSLYLIHWPVMKAVSHALYLAGLTTIWPTLLITIPLGAALSIALAWLFHTWVERRWLNRPQESAARVIPRVGLAT